MINVNGTVQCECGTSATVTITARVSGTGGGKGALPIALKNVTYPDGWEVLFDGKGMHHHCPACMAKRGGS